MLVLSRRIDESIVFPQLDIEISIVHLTHSQVRVGIKAPRKIKVLRGELTDDKKAKYAAAGHEPTSQQFSDAADTIAPAEINTSNEPAPNEPVGSQPVRCKTRIPLTAAQKRAFELEKLAQQDLATTRPAANVAANQRQDQGQPRVDRTSPSPWPERIADSDSSPNLPQLKSDADQLERKVTEARSKLAIALSIFNESQEVETIKRVADIQDKLAQLEAQLDLLRRKATTAAHPTYKTALLVDDNENESRLLASYLRVKGFEVIIANDGMQAMKCLEGNEIPDIMILDMLMPQFDGRWTIDEVRKNARYDGMRIIAVSGVDPFELGVDVGRAGVDRWFSKPLNPEVLVQSLVDPSFETEMPSSSE